MNYAVMQNWAKKKLKNLAPSIVSSSRSSHNLHFELEREAQLRTMANERNLLEQELLSPRMFTLDYNMVLVWF